MKVVDFTIPIGIRSGSGGGMVAVIPYKPSGNDITIMGQPFGWKLWICVLASPFIFLFALALSDKLKEDGRVMWWKIIDFILRCNSHTMSEFCYILGHIRPFACLQLEAALAHLQLLLENQPLFGDIICECPIGQSSWILLSLLLIIRC